ncbi:uncharacterized protein [Panulirus ornatus]|uniref:uncharacterized protein isoform X2 n=1 Tax=Panulirus ornatus TaxID=150431 RepID=UPI003A863CDE
MFLCIHHQRPRRRGCGVLLHCRTWLHTTLRRRTWNHPQSLPPSARPSGLPLHLSLICLNRDQSPTSSDRQTTSSLTSAPGRACPWSRKNAIAKLGYSAIKAAPASTHLCQLLSNAWPMDWCVPPQPNFSYAHGSLTQTFVRRQLRRDAEEDFYY